MEQQQPSSFSGALQPLNSLFDTYVQLNKSAQGNIPTGRGGPAHGSILERIPSNKENAQPEGATYTKSEYVKDRQPARSILRKADDGSQEKLESKFLSLQGEMQNFRTETQARRESLTGRTSLLAPFQPKQITPPAHASRPAEPAAPQWQPPQGQSRPQPDANNVQDDEGCMAGLGCHSSKDQLIVIPSGSAASLKVVAAAVTVFEDATLQKLCSEGLHKQLQRTKDGATDKSRIHELAELVKLLRKCVKELGSRTSMFIDQCTKCERELMQEMEVNKLAAKTSMTELQADIAAARQEAAGYQRESRDAVFKLGADLDKERAEATRLGRELDRLKSERDEARDNGRLAEQQRQQLEAELKELRRTAEQQARQISHMSSNQDEATRVLLEERQSLENKMAGLQDECNRIKHRMMAAEDCNKAYEEELHNLHAMVDDYQVSIKAKEIASAMQAEQITKLNTDLAQCRERVHSLTAERQRLEQELETSRKEATGTSATLQARVADLREQLALQQKRTEEERIKWDAVHDEQVASLSHMAEEKQQLSKHLAALKSTLNGVLEQLEQSKMRADHEATERASLLREHTNLQHQVEFEKNRTMEFERQATALRAHVQGLEAELAVLKQQVEDKDAKIAHLEGEFAALKEVLGDTAGGASGESGKDIVAKLLSKIATLQSNAAAAEAVRRKLHNELVDLRGNIRVYCRVRPHPTPATRLGSDGASITVGVDGREHSFSYDRVFGPDSSQETVFAAVSELVQSALDGFHVCIFSYGQTGAGKTHTMQGGDSPSSRGIIPRAVEKILATRRKLEEEAEWSYTMEASFIEVYNQGLRDLLSSGAAINDPNAIKHDAKGGHTVVMGAKKVEVADTDTAVQLIRQAAAARAVDATAMNSVSSRSHCVFMLNITGWHADSGTRLQGSLCLVDLAGSERLDRSQAEGTAKKETCAINASLSALGDVFAALSAKNSHVPYRNSKLTFLLQPCLGGNGKTLMFVNINPEPKSAGESLCSLRFAAKVSGCETGAKGGARRNVLTTGAGGGGSGYDAAGDPAGEPRRRGQAAPAPPPQLLPSAPSAAPAAAQPPALSSPAGAPAPSALPSFHAGRADPTPLRPHGARTASIRPPPARTVALSARASTELRNVPPVKARPTVPQSAAKGLASSAPAKRSLAAPSDAARPAAAVTGAAAAPPRAAPPDSSRTSLSGLPRPPSGGDPGAAGSSKRMSLLPQRTMGDAGASRMSLAGGGRASQQQGQGAVGHKRPAGAAPGNAAKRVKP